MLAKVIKFVEAEESGKYSLSDSKLFDRVSGVSTFKKQQRDPVKKVLKGSKGTVTRSTHMASVPSLSALFVMK